MRARYMNVVATVRRPLHSSPRSRSSMRSMRCGDRSTAGQMPSSICEPLKASGSSRPVALQRHTIVETDFNAPVPI